MRETNERKISYSGVSSTGVAARIWHFFGDGEARQAP